MILGLVESRPVVGRGLCSGLLKFGSPLPDWWSWGMYSIKVARNNYTTPVFMYTTPVFMHGKLKILI